MTFYVHPFFPLRFLPFLPENTKDNKHHTRKHNHFYKMVLKTMCGAIPRPAGSWPLGSLSITFFEDKERVTNIVVRKRCKVHRCTFCFPLVSPLSRKYQVLQGGKYPRPYWLLMSCFDLMRGKTSWSPEFWWHVRLISSSPGAVTEL